MITKDAKPPEAKEAMLHPDEALELILRNTPTLGTEKTSLEIAAGRILASEIKAADELPPFDNSAMDGYAVRSNDLQGASLQNPARLKVRGTVRAGSLPKENLGPGEAIAVMTGAPLPQGADAMVMLERTRRVAGWVEVSHAPRTGDHIRVRGEDVARGQILLKPGALLRPYEVALLAAQGLVKVEVISRPKVALLATGDELVEPSSPLSPGKIRNSNGPALASALARWGVPTLDLGVVPDEPTALEKAFSRALSEADILLVSGGVSVGDFDYTKAVLAKVGVQEVFWKVAIKPGKPLFFGIRPGGGESPKLVFGLPGNPVSVLVCLEEFVRPALEKLQGRKAGHPSYHLMGKAANAYPTPKDRRQYLFCRANSAAGGFELEIIRPQGSAMLGMAVRANALAMAPLGRDHVNPGDVLPFRWLK